MNNIYISLKTSYDVFKLFYNLIKMLQKKKIILIIDSDLVNLKLCKNIFEEHHCSVLVAQNTDSGLNLYRQQQQYIDLVLLNFQISGRSYFITIPSFLAINKDVKIIGMSDSISFKNLPIYFKEKVLDVINKPILTEHLLKFLVT